MLAPEQQGRTEIGKPRLILCHLFVCLENGIFFLFTFARHIIAVSRTIVVAADALRKEETGDGEAVCLTNRAKE